MRINLFATPGEVAESQVRDCVAAVIDVLRASTTVTAAWSRGAERIIPLAEVEEAKILSATFPRGTALLCGERDGLRIDGFDLGNSPAEFGESVVAGKTLLFVSTNGTRLMARQDGARERIVASFVNLSAAADHLASLGSDVAVLSAGRFGRFSLEDFVCGGALVSEVLARAASAETNDAALAARRLWEDVYRGRILDLFHDSSHGRYLVSLGFEEDLVFSAARDAIPFVPIIREGRIAGRVA